MTVAIGNKMEQDTRMAQRLREATRACMDGVGLVSGPPNGSQLHVATYTDVGQHPFSVNAALSINASDEPLGQQLCDDVFARAEIGRDCLGKAAVRWPERLIIDHSMKSGTAESKSQVVGVGSIE